MNTAFLPSIATLTVAVGCARTQPPPPQRYVHAMPAAEAPRVPVVVQVPKPMPLPGQLKRVPQVAKAGENAGAAVRRQPEDVIADANRKALAAPDADGFFNAIMTYDYAPGALYQIYTAPDRITALQLQPGEKIVGKPVSGDTIRWILGLGLAGAGPTQHQIVYIKPTRPDLTTTMSVSTDRRTYFLEVHSFAEARDAYMVSVQWRYPHDEIAQLETAAAQEDAVNKATTASLDLEALNFNYEVAVSRGTPSWVPAQVFDDGRKTYIRFPTSMTVREAPALFVLSSAKESQLVNYRVKNAVYIVDRLFQAAELRLGQKDQEIVRITRSR